MAEKGVSVLNETTMARRICMREDNHYYKHKMIKEILSMYSDELRQAMLNGERVQITKVCTLIPEIKVHEGNYNMPNCNTTEGNPPPFAKITISFWGIKDDLNKTLMRNLKEGVWGLKKLLFKKKDFEFLKETGYIPQDAEMPDRKGEQDLFGKVTKYFHDKGYGFIQGEDGNTYFVHVSKLHGEYLDKGYYVFFKTYCTDRSDYNAKDVIVINAPERKRRHG